MNKAIILGICIILSFTGCISKSVGEIAESCKREPLEIIEYFNETDNSTTWTFIYPDETRIIKRYFDEYGRIVIETYDEDSNGERN